MSITGKSIEIGVLSALFLLLVQTINAKAPTAPGLMIRNFNVEIKDEAVCVMWDVMNNQSDLHMLIERSSNGVSFDAVAAKTGYDDVDRTFYYFVDDKPVRGISYYKITLSEGSKILSTITKEIYLAPEKQKY